MDDTSGYTANQCATSLLSLTLWRSSEHGSWRASLQSIPTSERHMFADRESLLAFLVNHPWPPELARHDQSDETSAD